VEGWGVYKERMSAEIKNLAIVKNRLQREVRGLERALERERMGELWTIRLPDSLVDCLRS